VAQPFGGYPTIFSSKPKGSLTPHALAYSKTSSAVKRCRYGEDGYSLGTRTHVDVLRLVLIIFAAIAWGSAAHADEYYNFFSIRCVPKAQFMSIDSVGIYNIGNVVWPTISATDYDPTLGTTDYGKLPRNVFMSTQWRAHEEGLEQLEAEGLYVFGQAFGRYDPKPITCTTSAYTVSLTADPVERNYVSDDDIKVLYRGPLQVRIVLPDGRVVWDHLLPQDDSLRIDRDEITICKGEEYRYLEPQRSECTRISLRP
jgi:hypothetical protein